MSQVIDNRVVSMEFDNSSFERNVQVSMHTLDDLNRKIDSIPDTVGSGFSGLMKNLGDLDLSGITYGIDVLKDRFSALGIAGQEIIRELTRSAIQFGKNVWDNTLGQISSGGKRRSTNIAHAKFTLEGMGLNFEDYRQQIDDAVDGTAYGFDEAAKAASIFASSGVKAGDDMAKALRGISGVAAMTNSSYEEIAYVFEQVNGMGKVTGQSLNMISGRGLNAAAALGKALGKTEEEIHKMVSKGQIDFQTFANAMDDAFGEHAKDANKTLDGVVANCKAQLARIGQAFYDPLIQNESGLVKMFQSLRAKIKEIKGVTDPFAVSLANQILKLAGIGKKLIDGFDANKLKPLFDYLANASVDAEIGIENLVNGFIKLHNQLAPIRDAAKDAFFEVFPKKNTMSPLILITKKFSNFMQKLVVGGETVDKFKRVFKGMFSAVSLGIKIFKDLLHTISPVTDKIKDLASTVLDLAADIGDFFTELNDNYEIGKPFESLKEKLSSLKVDFSFVGVKGSIKDFFNFIKTSFTLNGGGIEGVVGVLFDSLSEGFYKLSDILKDLGLDKVAELFFNLGVSIQEVKNKVIEFGKGILDSFHPVEKLKTIFSSIKTFFINLWNSLAPLRSAVKSILTPLWEAIKQIGSAISEGLRSPGGFVNLAAMMIMFEQLRLKLKNLKWQFDNLKEAFGDRFSKLLNKGFWFEKIGGTIDNLKGTLFQMTKELKARAIIEIAAAIAILALAFMLLASVDSDKLWAAGAAMGGILLAVGGLLKELDSFGDPVAKTKGFKDAILGTSDALREVVSQERSLKAMTSALIKIAVAVLILAVAMKLLAGIDYGHMVAATIVLGAFCEALLAMVNKMKEFTQEQASTITKLALAMILMSLAVKILASAVAMFDGIPWQSVVLGIAAVAAMMFGLTLMTKYLNDKTFNSTLLKTAAAMVVMAIAIRVLASSVKALAGLDTKELVAGVLGVIALLVVMGASIIAISKLAGDSDFLKVGAGFLMVAIALRLVVSAFKALGEMDSDTIAQAFMAFTFILAELTVVLLLTNDTMLKCGAGMLLLAVAMVVLTGAIFMLGSMDIMALIQGLGGLAAGLIILSVALKFIQGSIVGAAALLIVSVALIPFALALMMLTSLNLADLAGTILVLVVALAALTVVCYAMSGAIIGAAALLVLSVALLAFGVACSILVALPLLDLAATLLVVAAALVGFAALSLVLMPLLIPMAALAGIMMLIAAALAVLGAAVFIFAMGVQTLAVSGQMGTMVLLTLCQILAKNLGMLSLAAVVLLALAAALLILDAALLVAAVSMTLCAVALTALSAAMLIFAAAAVVFAASLLLVIAALEGSLKAIKELLDAKKFKEIAGNAIDGIKQGFKEGIAKVVSVAKELGEKVLSAIKSFGDKLKQAGADAILGFINGLKSKLGDAKQAAATVGQSCLNKLKSVFKIKSPSRVTMAMGKLVDEGLAIGLKRNSNLASNAAGEMGDEVVDSMSDSLRKITDVMNSDMEPTITPVMDLSEIQNGMSSMDSMLDRNRVANISANYNANRLSEMAQMASWGTQMNSLRTDINSLADALLNQPAPEVNANVVLQGDADGVFKLVQQSNNMYSKRYGKSAFA